MYLKHLRIKNLKLVRDLELDFTHDGEPRHFTVFLGENGLCKTALLQAIALAASGADRANQLVEVASFPDLRQPDAKVEIKAEFSFSERFHAHRKYPGLELHLRPSPPPVFSELFIQPGFDVFDGRASYNQNPPSQGVAWDEMAWGSGYFAESDPLREARALNLNHWFVAGYGVGRTLPASATVTAEELSSPSRDRLTPLFKVSKRLIGTGFADLLPFDRAQEYVKVLRQAFVEHEILPKDHGLKPRDLTLQARGQVNNARERIFAHRMVLELPRGEIAVPMHWLSQGYQSTTAWIADLIGQIWWESGKRVVPLEEMEGICLVDEIDLHLHPLWQANLVRGLKRAFPRIQFITTTHSPMILPGLEEQEIVRLGLDEEGNVTARAAGESPKLMTGSELFRTFFGIDRLLPRELDDALFRYGSLASYAGRSDEEEVELNQALDLLRQNGIDPGYAPVPREGR